RVALNGKGDLMAVAYRFIQKVAVIRIADAKVLGTAAGGPLRDIAFSASGDAVAMTGGAQPSGMWRWGTDPAPVALPPAMRLIFHPKNEAIVAVIGEQLTIQNWQ